MQDLDSRLDRLAHRRRSLPEQVAAAELATRRSDLIDRVVGAETQATDLQRELSKAEADVDQVRSRAERDRQRLDAGRVGSPKELEGLQHELSSLGRRQSDLEDIVLEVMERLEDEQTRAAALSAERDAVAAELAATEQRRDDAYADIDRESLELAEQRKSAAAEIPADLLALYEKIREQQGGVGAAALHQRRCEGCRLELNSTEMAEMRSAAEDEVLRHEECRRILVRVAESGL